MTASESSTTAVATVLAGYSDITDWQVDLYRDLHQHPELSDQEIETARKAARTLRDAGFEVHEHVGSTGVVGVLANGDGPVVLMRADMDALPMQEATGLPYASTAQQRDAQGHDTPVAHACGHDVHVATLLGAARLLADARSAWAGTFIALFQPAEETGAGAAGMVNGGLRDLIPRPDVALAQHVLAYPAGSLGILAGPYLSTAASLRIIVHGRGSHGSMPHLSVDPVLLAAVIIVRLQTIVAREVPPGEFAVLTVGRVAAGTKSNIIPDRAEIELNVRAYADDVRRRIIDSIKRIVVNECEASNAPKPPDFEEYGTYPLTMNDADVTATVRAAFADHFRDRLIPVPRESASEDFSVIPDALGIPYAFWALGGTNAAAWHAADAAGTRQADIPGNHSPAFAPEIQPTLETGTAAIVAAALAWLAA